MDAISLHFNTQICSIEVFIFNFTDRTAIYCISKVSTKARHVKIFNTISHFLIWCKCDADITVLEYSELDTVEIDDIITLAFDIPNKAKAVVSVGGGKVIDAGKYAAFLRNLPFISVPTSSSSDGFSSASASLLVHGKRTSVPAKLAHGIIVDTQVIRTAPEKFIYSGIGDMVSKITALYDWIFEEKHGAGVVNDFAVMVAKKAVNSFVRTPYESIKDELFLKELVDSLAMSGIANEIAGSSAPTSGSEHLISHALDKIS